MRHSYLVIGSVFILIAAIFHVYVFTLESLTWRKPKTWKTFGLPSQEHAEIIAPMALNQGFYNLFLAIGAGVGLVLITVDRTIGYTLIFSAALSMVAAGAVLFLSVKKSRRAGIIQAGPPLLGVLFILLGL